MKATILGACADTVVRIFADVHRRLGGRDRSVSMLRDLLGPARWALRHDVLYSAGFELAHITSYLQQTVQTKHTKSDKAIAEAGLSAECAERIQKAFSKALRSDPNSSPEANSSEDEALLLEQAGHLIALARKTRRPHNARPARDPLNGAVAEDVGNVTEPERKTKREGEAVEDTAGGERTQTAKSTRVGKAEKRKMQTAIALWRLRMLERSSSTGEVQQGGEEEARDASSDAEG